MESSWNKEQIVRLRGPDLTAENLFTALKEEKDRWNELGDFLLVPNTVRNYIRRQHSTSSDRLNAVIKYVLELHPYASWRLFIRALDRLSSQELADKIRSFAEPVADPTLTVDNVTGVILKTEKDWSGQLGVVLLIPACVRDNINVQHSGLDAKKRSLMTYWVQTIYNASWSTLAGVLYYLEEENALVECKNFLNTERDDTLTIEKLLTTLEDVTDWNGLGRCLRLPRTLRDQIKENSTYQTDGQRKRAVIEIYLNHHPAPNWKEVAWALCMMTSVNYVDTDKVKNHQSLRKMYNREVITAPGEQRQLDCFRAAIQTNGSLVQVVMNAILHGYARSGKTSLIRVLQGKKAITNQPSTGAMDEPKRIEITQSAVKMDGLTWTPVDSLEEEAALVVQEVNKSDQRSLLENTGEEIKITTEDYPQNTASLSGPSSNLTTPNSDSLQSSLFSGSLSSDIRLSRIIENAIKNAKAKVKALKHPWTLYLSDIGGQLEFQELIPALTNGPSLHFIIIAAHLGLNCNCPVEYLSHNGEKSVPYLTNCTVKENVLQQLATIMSTGRGNQTPKIVFFLTFKDQVTAQELSKLDQELQEVIMATKAYHSGAIEFAEEFLLCHPINNCSPDEEDVQRIRKTIERIGKRDETYQIPTPYTWLYFGIALREVKEKVLSYDSCLEIGKGCGICTREEIDCALYFLHYNMGVIRHFKEVPELKDIVIKEPQLLFDSVTELVVNTFTFNQVSHSNRRQFLRKGIFPVETVKQMSIASSLLTSEKFMAFMRHYHIIAPIMHKNSVKKYFLPCSLVHAPIEEDSCGEKSHYLPSLLFYFDAGYTLRGVFGFLLSDLISNFEQLDIELKEDLIFRDQVSLSVGPYQDTFQLTSNPMYICIKVLPSNIASRSTPLGEVCCAFKKTIENGLITVIEKLNYTNDSSHKLAFECPHYSSESEPQGTAHPALIKLDCRGNPCSLKCVAKGQPMELPTGYKVWFNQDECHMTYQDNQRKRHWCIDREATDQINHFQENYAIMICDHENIFYLTDTKKIKLETPQSGGTCTLHHSNLEVVAPLISLSTVAADIKEITARLDINHLQLVQLAVWEIRLKWFELGLALHVDQQTLQVIQQRQMNNPDDCLPDMLSTWLKKYSPVPTLQDLVRALKSPEVGATVVLEATES